MTKPPYIKSFTVPKSHRDLYTETIIWKDPKYGTSFSVFWDNLVTYAQISHSHTSISTKPWPNGVPPYWTSQSRSHSEILSDSSSGRVVWSPGPSWPDVNTRTRERSGGYGMVFTALPWQPFSFEFPDKDTLDNKIRNKLNADVNALVALAEVQKSVDSAAHRLARISLAALALKKGDFRKASAYLGDPRKKVLSSARRRLLKREIVDPRYRALASGWLELQYGWLPLISDIYGFIDYSKNSPKSSFILAKSKKLTSDSWNFTAPSNLDGGIGIHKETQRCEASRSYLVEYSVSDPYLKATSETGLLNPLTVAWELVPFSFVVDWFLPIGSALSSLSASCGSQIIGCLYVEKYTFYRTRSSSLKGASGQDVASGSGSFDEKLYSYSRTLTNFPSAKLPSFKNPVSTAHAANALALVTSIFTKR